MVLQRSVAIPALVALAASAQTPSLAAAFSFAPSPAFVAPTRTRGAPSPPDRRTERCTPLRSSTGDDARPPPPDEDPEDDGLGGFLTPKEESENLKKAREYLSETSLPINFDLEEGNVADGPERDIFGNEKKESKDGKQDNSSALSFSSAGQFFPNTPSAELLAKNPYLQVVSKLSPSDIISKFTANAHPRVQDAVRNTILGLIGNLPKMAFDTTTVTTGQRLASLMFQLQMTGYLFKNAEYRLSLSQSLEEMNFVERKRNNFLLSGSSDEDEEEALLKGKIRGKLKIRYGGVSLPKDTSGDDKESGDGEEEASGGAEMEVDASAYMSELRAEVARLRDELDETRQSNSEAVRKDLLLYIRTLPRQELQSLTNTMTQEVLVGMKGLVQAVLAGIGDDQIGPDTVTEQSSEAMAQLCMWQLAVGYNLRELEVREEMKKQLKGNAVSTSNNDEGAGSVEGGVDFSDPNAFE